MYTAIPLLVIYNIQTNIFLVDTNTHILHDRIDGHRCGFLVLLPGFSQIYDITVKVRGVSTRRNPLFVSAI